MTDDEYQARLVEAYGRSVGFKSFKHFRTVMEKAEADARKLGFASFEDQMDAEERERRQLAAQPDRISGWRDREQAEK